ncbi:hypothetical protein H6H00_00430 [Pseudonocardia petroleophila]|uniref:Uncharacterized protein n=2 Tax=Pseudonocardia petroleophila TaxID=37331 RepID=A0A7G7MR51_9PSEU|nr:hypothetical protein H6H00_00430 [Pseudonocardia petroleophila]
MAAACVRRLLEADAAYQDSVSTSYDEVVVEVIARVGDVGSVGKLDIAALTTWKRLRADTRWAAELMSWPDAEVRRHTAQAVTFANDASLSVPDAAGQARGALSPLPGFGTGDALASTVCFVAAPDRLAVYDRRAHAAVSELGFDLNNRPGRYRRFMTIVENCRAVLLEAGHDWSARRVDTALFQLGG